MTDVGTRAGSGSVVGVCGGFGLVVAVGAGAAGVGGPLLVGEVVDDDGGLVGVVGVVDGDTSGLVGAPGGGGDGLLAGLVPVAAVEAGGEGRVGTPVGSGVELVERFSMPVVETVFTDSAGVPWVVWVTTTDRRTQPTTPNPNTGTNPNPNPATATNPNPATGTGTGSGSGLGSGSGVVGGLEKLLGVGLEVSVELGRTRVTLAEVLDFDVGSTVELDRGVGAPVDVRVNDTLLAQGEVVMVDDEYAVRITAIFDPGNPKP